MSNQNEVYQETIPFGKVYHSIMGGLLFLLFAILIAFSITGLFAGMIALLVAIPFVIWVFIGCRKTDLFITNDRFEVRYWFMKLSIPVSNIASVFIRDEIVLPLSYQGHIKVGYGWHSWKYLKVIVCRNGLLVVEIKTKEGVTVIVTPLHADKIVEILNHKNGERSNTYE